MYRFCSTDGYIINDAHLLSADSDIGGAGDVIKPRAGSPCVALMSTNGAGCFIVGFHRPPEFDETKDEDPKIPSPATSVSPGDKVYGTAGGAALVLKRGGSLFVEAGPGVSIVCNPQNNQMTLRSSNYKVVADGHSSTRGRQEVGKTEPETVHRDDFLDMAGGSHYRLRIDHGNLEGGAKRRLELAQVTVAGGAATAVVKARETYFDDGRWIGEAKEYRWGGAGAGEPAVLGNELVSAFNTLFQILKTLTVGTAFGPSTPPLANTQTQIEQLQKQLSGKILSTFIYLSKNPPSL